MQGFTIKVERKKGCVLHSRLKESSKDTPYTNAGVDEHFQVTVTYDGTNPLYPGESRSWVKLLTNSLTNNPTFGFVGSVTYEPLNSRFTRVEISERYENWHNADIMGRIPSPEHVVWLEIYTKKRGSSELRSAFGLLTRRA